MKLTLKKIKNLGVAMLVFCIIISFLYLSLGRPFIEIVLLLLLYPSAVIGAVIFALSRESRKKRLSKRDMVLGIIGIVIVAPVFIWITLSIHLPSLIEKFTEASYNDIYIEEYKWKKWHPYPGECELQLKIYSTRKLYAKYYVDNVWLSSSFEGLPDLIFKGENTINLFIPFDSLKPIELKICYSTKKLFTQYDKNVICKSKVISPPRISLEASPVPVYFIFTQRTSKSQLIYITNYGEIPVYFKICLPESDYHYLVFSYDCEKYSLEPGESTRCEITITNYIKNVFGHEYLPYRAEIAALGRGSSSEFCKSALYKKDFDIKVEVYEYH